jgi:hypothetical protein
MKRVLGITFALLTLGFVVPAEAKTAESSHENATVAANSAPQWQRYENRRYDRNRRSTRTVTRSRLVRNGRRLYRETFVVRYYPNGRVDTRLISRTRVS